LANVGDFNSFIFMLSEFRKHQLDHRLIGRVILNSEIAEVGELSLVLLEKMIDARSQRAAGGGGLVRRGKAIPGRLIDWLITCMLEALAYENAALPDDFVALLRGRLGDAARPDYQRAVATNNARWKAINLGLEILLMERNPPCGKSPGFSTKPPAQ
jgi:hypothetical protein